MWLSQCVFGYVDTGHRHTRTCMLLCCNRPRTRALQTLHTRVQAYSKDALHGSTGVFEGLHADVRLSGQVDPVTNPGSSLLYPLVKPKKN